MADRLALDLRSGAQHKLLWMPVDRADVPLLAALTELLRYQHGAGDYAGNDADERFVAWMADQRMVTHDAWATLVPSSADVAGLAEPEQ